MDATPELLKRITTRPEVLGGKPIIRDMRMAVEHILGMMAAGETQQTILEQYDFLEPEDIQACMLFAYHAVAERGAVGEWAKQPLHKPRPRSPEEIEARRLAIHQAVDEAVQYHQSQCQAECQCREDDIDVMLEQIERGRGVIP